LAVDLLATGRTPLAPGVIDRQAIRKARGDLGGEKARPAVLADAVAGEQQFGHHPGFLVAAALKLLGVSRVESRGEGQHTSCRGAQAQPLTRSIAAPHTPSLSSSRSKPRSRW